MIKTYKSGLYNKNMKEIAVDERELGAILYTTKDFDSLKKFLKKFDYKKVKKTLRYAKNDVIIDVFNGWSDIDIKVYEKTDYKKRHRDYLKIMK